MSRMEQCATDYGAEVENMRGLYISGSYESVQRHLDEALNSSGFPMKFFIYSKNIDGSKGNTIWYSSRIKGKGPFLYLTVLRDIADVCLRKVKKEKIDILHGNMLFSSGYICRYLSEKLDIPFVVSVRDTDINTLFLWKCPWLRKMGLRNLKYASKVFFLSERYKEQLIQKLPGNYIEEILGKSVVIPNGIDSLFLDNIYERNGMLSPSVKAIYVGKINKRKNIEGTIEAVQILRESGLDISLDIVGKIEESQYRSLIEHTPFLTYYEACPPTEVLQHLRDADIFVMPSHTETFGLVYAEAMSQGLPVIYTRGQGFDGQFPEGTVGYSVDDTDTIEIANRIRAIIDNYEKMSKNCSAVVRRFDWSLIAERMTTEYKKIILLEKRQ